MLHCRPGEAGLVVVKYEPKQALQAMVTFESTLELDQSASSPDSAKRVSDYLQYLRGFRGAGMPMSTEKVAIAFLQKHGVVILSAPSPESSHLCCQFAPDYACQ